jgi:ribose transport system permease protein
MIKRFALDRYSALYLWAAFIVIFGALRPGTFLTWTSIKLVLIENVIIGVLAISFLVPLATGTYDLAIGRSMSMALVIVNSLAKNDVSPVLGMVIALVACAVAGALAGLIVVKLRVNSFIATLGMSQLLYAFIQRTSRQTISGELSPSYQRIGTREIFGLPLYVYTPAGRYMFATGGNPDAARLAGVRTDRLVFLSLIASSVIAGFAGLIYSWKVGTYSESIGPGLLFPAIAAVFFGASQLKGRPNVWGALIALFALATGVKGLQLTFSSNTNWIEPLFQGLSLLIAVSLASRHLVVKVNKRRTASGPGATSPVASN